MKTGVCEKKKRSSLQSSAVQNLYVDIWCRVRSEPEVDMLHNNSNTHINGGPDTSDVDFDLKLTLKMGRIKKTNKGFHEIGPNLSSEPHNCTLSDDSKVK